MAILKDKLVELNVSETYIGNDVSLKGDINIKGSIRIDGLVNGNISEAKTVSVGKNAKINGNISCQKCLISGSVCGNVYALESVELSETASLNGDIKSKSISMEAGCKFNGKCAMEFDTAAK